MLKVGGSGHLDKDALVHKALGNSNQFGLQLSEVLKKLLLDELDDYCGSN